MKSKQKRAWMTPSEVSLFCQQVELLLQSGIPLYEGMRSLADNYQSTPYREALTELAQKVDETGSLYEGMRESPLFPAYVREMVRLGERLGELENVCHGLATYYEREDNIRKAIRNAVTYPLVLIAMMACVIAVLMTRVLPIFRQVLGEMGEVTREGGSLASLGMGLGYGVLAVLGVLILCLLGPGAGGGLCVQGIPTPAQAAGHAHGGTLCQYYGNDAPQRFSPGGEHGAFG